MSIAESQICVEIWRIFENSEQNAQQFAHDCGGDNFRSLPIFLQLLDEFLKVRVVIFYDQGAHIQGFSDIFWAKSWNVRFPIYRRTRLKMRRHNASKRWKLRSFLKVLYVWHIGQNRHRSFFSDAFNLCNLSKSQIDFVTISLNFLFSNAFETRCNSSWIAEIRTLMTWSSCCSGLLGTQAAESFCKQNSTIIWASTESVFCQTNLLFRKALICKGFTTLTLKPCSWKNSATPSE